MKKLIASVGLVTLGAAGVQAAYAPGLSTMETSKPWSISATLRGFYDDNYNNAPAHPTPGSGIPSAQSSPGFEISPSLKFNLPMEQTYIGLGALYSMKYYTDRKSGNIDHMVELTLKADHRLSERYKISFDDSFVYSLEPDATDSTGTITTFQRQEVIRNRGLLAFRAQLTEVLGAEASYQNTWYKYLNSDVLAANLDRVEHLFDVHGTWLLQEHLTGLFGYQYGINDFTSDLPLGGTNSATGSIRDNTSHYFYVGAEHAFSSQFNGTIRVGAEYTSWDNLHTSAWGPYVDLRGTYTYLPGSSVQFGFTHNRNATDVVGSDATGITTDQESSTLFGSINHRITPRLTGSVLGQYQHSVFHGGAANNQADDFFLVGLNLEYRINPHWTTEIGYNFDHLSSDLADRSFTRNRVYAGVRANF